jgi:DNA (cytosine-5)-methyltransferase 1
VRSQGVEHVFDGRLGAEPTDAENACVEEVGPIDALIGGPPCQGHSNLNNHTRRDDPKNGLYLRMARASEILRPQMVLIENVPAVRHDKRNVVTVARAHLETLGYRVSERIVRLENFGVPQRRRRHILLGTMANWPDPEVIFRDAADRPCEARNLAWAIGDLVDLPQRTGLDKIPAASDANLERMKWLLEKNEFDLPNRLRPRCHQDDHSYKSMYGRLRWSEPAQTITSGFSSIGQGRYMHPDQPRALTAHEAARIQGFPDYFVFSVVNRRVALGNLIGNAVPPQLGRELFAVGLLKMSERPSR